jgi:hypothetical protein
MTRHAGGRRRSRGHAEARSRSPDMRVHARLADPEKVRYLFRRETARDGAEHLTLPVGQSFDRPGASAKDTLGNEVPGNDPDECGSRALHHNR